MKTKIHKEAWIGPNAKIGKNGCKIQPLAFIPDGVTIEDDVFIGPGATFTNDKYPPSNGKGWQKTYVLKGSVIGANATILPGIVIGPNAIVGAGSVVTQTVPADEVWVGNPAKFRRNVDTKSA
ncbi:MAG: N-acetyltransferase [Nanoarchaeota archaeon]|nr:N-acetyltransferase [Nanoarchaeota archaeon]